MTEPGTETLTFMLSNIDQDRASAVLSDLPDIHGNRGAVYTTEALPVGFSFEPWGQYEEIGFLGGEYFAAYDDEPWNMTKANQSVPFLYDKSTNRNLMTNEQISEILIDDDTEQTLSSSNPLELEEGYNLTIKIIILYQSFKFVAIPFGNVIRLGDVRSLAVDPY